ncbi:MAG: SDR family oxidoreductase [Victivallales bacterium]|nr:SDR family oxidoreductase [Victivallales bacterium]
MDFLQLFQRNLVVMGMANRRSVASAVAKTLRDAGANVLYVFKDGALLQKNRPLIGEETPAVTCDVSSEEELAALPMKIAAFFPRIDGLVHSIAFANYSEGMLPFHDIARQDFLQATDISCFSLIRVCHYLKDLFAPDASIVTISISATRMASESYGYMAPVKAALDSSVVFLAKSLSTKISPDIRVNAVGASPLKTNSSAGIPGYVDSFLYAEKATMRHRALLTEEVANVVAFLVSPRSSGITAQTIITDAGMSCNYFDKQLLHPQ